MNFKLKFIPVALAAVACMAMSITPKPAESDVAGVWLGTGKGHRMIGLQLATNHTGRVCISFPNNASFYDYQIDQWRLTNFTVRVKSHPIGSNTLPVSFGSIESTQTGLTIDIDKEKIDLWRENDWNTRSADIKKHVAE